MSIDLRSLIPPRPAFSGTIAPIYLEPMPGSGERITIAIIALGNDRSMRVHPVIHQDTMTCLYGSKAKNMQGLVELCSSSLREHLGKTRSLSDWIPPLTTATLGAQRKAYAESMTALIGQGVRMHASLGVLPRDAEEVDTDTTDDRRNWDDEIREAASPSIHPYFGKRVQLTAASARQTQIGFMHERYAANFALLSPGSSLGAAVNSAKAKLWNLQMLRSAPKVQHRGTIELIVGHADPEFDPSMGRKALSHLKDAVSELKEEANRSDLGLLVVHNHAMAAEHIFMKVA